MATKIEMSESQDLAVYQSSTKKLISDDQGEAVSEPKKSNILDDTGENLGFCGIILYVLSIFLCIVLFPIAIFFVFKIVKQYEKAVIFRLGKVNKKSKGPGLFTFLPCTDRIVVVDMRTHSFDIPPQEVLTKDSVSCRVDGVVYYRIQDAVLSTCNVLNVNHCTKLLAQVTLRNMLGTMTLTDILLDRDLISKRMEAILDEATDPWGVKVERVELKDVCLPVNLQRAMAAEAESARDAKAKVIAAEGELNASKALREASDVITDNSTALQLRYLQTIANIATEQNSTILFPMPIDMTSAFLGNETNA